MTTTSDHTNSNNKTHHNHDKRNQKDRRHQQSPLRRSAAELIAQPPRGYTVTVHELEGETKARKRARLLILESENGWKFVPFMSVRVEKNARTAGADISVLDDLDIIPSNIVESGIEVNLLSDDALLALATLVTEYRERQKTIVPAHKRPFVQRPFEQKLTRLIEDGKIIAASEESTLAEGVSSSNTQQEEDDVAKSNNVKKSEKQQASQPEPKLEQPKREHRRPRRYDGGDSSWWFASVC